MRGGRELNILVEKPRRGKKVRRASAPFRVNARSASTDSKLEQDSEVEGSCSLAAVSVGLLWNPVSLGSKLYINTSAIVFSRSWIGLEQCILF